MKHFLPCLLLLLSQDDAAPALKSDGWRAVQAFVEKGEASRPALEKARAGGDSDVAFFAAAALGELDCRRAGEFAPVARTRSLGGDASTVVAALFKSAGLEGSLEGLPEKKLTIPDGTTFAEAVETASRELNVEFVQGENGTWKPLGEFVKTARFASGRVRARIGEISHGSYWRPGLPARCMYWVKATMDGFGRFAQAPLYIAVRVIEAVDERGRTLRPKVDWDEDQVDRPDPKRKDRHAGFSISLEAPDASSTRIARLRLAVDFAFRKKEGVISFDKLEGVTSVKKKVGDVEATLVRAEMDDDGYRVEFKLRAQGIDARLSRGEDDFIGEPVVHVLDARNKGWEARGGSTSTDSREYEYKHDFQNPGNAGPPVTINISMITEVEVRSAFLEFREVPLR